MNLAEMHVATKGGHVNILGLALALGSLILAGCGSRSRL
jgi:hypothetical protein